MIHIKSDHYVGSSYPAPETVKEGMVGDFGGRTGVYWNNKSEKGELATVVWEADCASGTAAEGIAAGQLVYYAKDAQKIYKTAAGDGGKMHFAGYAITSASADEIVEFRFIGREIK